MIPIQLTISGFLSYRDPVEIDFTSIDLACISGANGAGKSSLLDSITWALFGQARKRDDSVINTQSETAEVQFTFSYENNIYRVQRVKPRGKTTLLEFHIQANDNAWKPLTERTLRSTEAHIESTLRLDYDTFTNASFFLQGKADKFTQQKASERKQILSNILGLEVWDVYKKRTIEKRKVVDSNIGAFDGRLQEINTELGEEDSRKIRLGELETSLETISAARATQDAALDELRARASSLANQEKIVQTFFDQLSRAEKNRSILIERLTSRKEDMGKHQALVLRSKEIETGYQTWQANRKDLEIWDQVAAQFHEHEKQRHNPLTEIETAKARLEAELKSLSEDQSQRDESKVHMKEIEKQLTTAELEFKNVSTKLAERTSMDEELNSAIKKQADAHAENPRLKTEMEKLKTRINHLDQTNGAACPVCGQTLSAAERKNLITSLESEGKQKGDNYRTNQTMIKEVDKLVNNLESKIKGFDQIEIKLREYTRLVDQLNTQKEQIKSADAEWQKSGKARLKEIEATLAKEEYAKDARKSLAAIDVELKKIGYDAAKHDSVRKLEAENRQAEEQYRLLDNARAALVPLKREIKDIESQVEIQTEEIKQQKAEHDKASADLKTAQTDAPDVIAAESKMLQTQEEENKLRLEVGAARQKVEILEELKKRHADIETQREELAQQVARYRALEAGFGRDGVPAMLIEQALPQIEIKANEILERLSGGDMSISFITQQAYKDKKRDDLKETLDIQISDSAGYRDYDMFSGGEAFRINFAIRLALSEVLAQRAGARLQTLVIDEGFGSQDEAGRQRLIEAINLIKDDFAKILVITHIEALKDAFPSRIEVEKTPRGSVVQVIQ